LKQLLLTGADWTEKCLQQLSNRDTDTHYAAVSRTIFDVTFRLSNEMPQM